jgi:hypothetical protein
MITRPAPWLARAGTPALPAYVRGRPERPSRRRCSGGDGRRPTSGRLPDPRTRGSQVYASDEDPDFPFGSAEVRSGSPGPASQVATRQPPALGDSDSCTSMTRTVIASGMHLMGYGLRKQPKETAWPL